MLPAGELERDKEFFPVTSFTTLLDLETLKCGLMFSCWTDAGSGALRFLVTVYGVLRGYWALGGVVTGEMPSRRDFLGPDRGVMFVLRDVEGSGDLVAL